MTTVGVRLARGQAIQTAEKSFAVELDSVRVHAIVSGITKKI